MDQQPDVEFRAEKVVDGTHSLSQKSAFRLADAAPRQAAQQGPIRAAQHRSIHGPNVAPPAITRLRMDQPLEH